VVCHSQGGEGLSRAAQAKRNAMVGMLRIVGCIADVKAWQVVWLLRGSPQQYGDESNARSAGI
jgi:hypothetical protein